MPDIPHTIVKTGAHLLAKGLADMKKAGNLPLLAWDCEAPNGDPATRDNFNTAVGNVVNATRYTMMAVMTSATILKTSFKSEILLSGQVRRADCHGADPYDCNNDARGKGDDGRGVEPDKEICERPSI